MSQILLLQSLLNMALNHQRLPTRHSWLSISYNAGKPVNYNLFELVSNYLGGIRVTRGIGEGHIKRAEVYLDLIVLQACVSPSPEKS